MTTPDTASPGRRLVRWCATLITAVIPLAAALSAIPAAAATVRSDTQARMPYNLYFADLDGGGTAELLQTGGNKVFGFKTDHLGTPLLHNYYDSTVKRLLVGHFATTGREHDRDDVCAILASGTLNCSAPSPDGTQLWWWFSQANFVADDEEAVVGDFDGNGNDDILVYQPATGAMRMYTREVSGAFYFQPMPNFDLGNLAGFNRTHKQFLVGEFGQAAGRADLLMLDATTGQVVRFDSATNPTTGVRQFWWAFTTNAGVLHSDEDASVARLTNGSRDGLVLRTRGSGAVRLKRAEWAAGNTLADVTGVDAAALVHPGNGQLAFAKMAVFPAEPGGTVRDDVLFINRDSRTVRRQDARWDGTSFTYWYYYENVVPSLNTGWSAVRKDPWTVVMCTVRGSTTPLARDAAWWHRMFSLGEPGSIGGYFWDMSYGGLDLSGTAVYGTYQIPYTWAQLQARGGDARNVVEDECAAAASRAGHPVTGKLVAYVNVPAFGGLPGRVVVTDDIGPNYLPLSSASLGHEMTHGYGANDNLNDAVDPSQRWYGDPWDIMSCGACTTTTGMGGFGGPGLNAGNRVALGLLTQVRPLASGTTRQTVTLDVAALDRPEATATHLGGVLTVRIPIPAGAVPECVPGNTCSTSGNYYTVELRQPRGWDAGFSRDAVFVHKVMTTNGLVQPVLKRMPNPELLAGATFTDSHITVRVNSIDTARSVANVTITY